MGGAREKSGVTVSGIIKSFDLAHGDGPYKAHWKVRIKGATG